jgi:hypothetical protein
LEGFGQLLSERHGWDINEYRNLLRDLAEVIDLEMKAVGVAR